MNEEKLEDFTEDLQMSFGKLLVEQDPEAIEIYKQILKLLDKKRDEALSVPYDLEPDISPQELAKLHESANVDRTVSRQGGR